MALAQLTASLTANDDGGYLVAVGPVAFTVALDDFSAYQQSANLRDIFFMLTLQALLNGGVDLETLTINQLTTAVGSLTYPEPP